MTFRNHTNHHMSEFKKINKYKHQKYYGAVSTGKYNTDGSIEAFNTPPYYIRKAKKNEQDLDDGVSR